MADQSRYRRQAGACRQQAAMLRDRAAERWLQIAAEYDKLADEVEASGPPTPVQHMPMQQQPMQQQQSKTEPEDKT